MKTLSTKNLSPEQTLLLEEKLDDLLIEYKEKGLVLESLIPIIGRPPVIPDSPETDTGLGAYEAKIEYVKKLKEIEQILKAN